MNKDHLNRILVRITGIRIAMMILLFALSGTVIKAEKYTIQVSGTTFSPDTVMGVQIGDTIRWKWIDGSHTTTSVDIPTGAAAWDNPLNESNSSFEYIVTVSGTYTFKCVPHELLGMKGLFEVEQVSDIGNPEQVMIDRFLVFPNPVGEELSIQFTTPRSISCEVRLINLIGEKSATWLLEATAGETRKTYPVSHMRRGIYFLEVYSGKDRMITQKVIKE